MVVSINEWVNAMRMQFEKSLSTLYREMVTMSDQVEEMLEKSIDALVRKDGKSAQEIINMDDLIDQKEIELQERCIHLITAQQPVAMDLRKITAAIKILSNLERIADHAVNICNITLKLQDTTYMKPLVDIPKMGKIAREMMELSIDSYVKQDIQSIELLIAKENELDRLNDTVFKDLVGFMTKDASYILQGSYFTFIASSLERIGDHTTNIFESVYYIVKSHYKDFKALEDLYSKE
ncbi:MAG TPA: phosphate transport system regulatory protein PhoU [Eubacteriaceae bacterium]|nr:phosphate transport system regulatory protein PhoU [Eubacteriaceae bacterium]